MGLFPSLEKALQLAEQGGEVSAFVVWLAQKPLDLALQLFEGAFQFHKVPHQPFAQDIQVSWVGSGAQLEEMHQLEAQHVAQLLLLARALLGLLVLQPNLFLAGGTRALGELGGRLALASCLLGNRARNSGGGRGIGGAVNESFVLGPKHWQGP